MVELGLSSLHIKPIGIHSQQWFIHTNSMLNKGQWIMTVGMWIVEVFVYFLLSAWWEAKRSEEGGGALFFQCGL